MQQFSLGGRHSIKSSSHHACAVFEFLPSRQHGQATTWCHSCILHRVVCEAVSALYLAGDHMSTNVDRDVFETLELFFLVLSEFADLGYLRIRMRM